MKRTHRVEVLRHHAADQRAQLDIGAPLSTIVAAATRQHELADALTDEQLRAAFSG